MVDLDRAFRRVAPWAVMLEGAAYLSFDLWAAWTGAPRLEALSEAVTLTVGLHMMALALAWNVLGLLALREQDRVQSLHPPGL